MNIVLSWLLRFPEMERKAIIVMASQKNLPTAAVIISYFDAATVGNLGLMTIPCIVFYIMQLFIDSFIANTWASKYEHLSAVEATYKEQLQQIDADLHDSHKEGMLGTAVADEPTGTGSNADMFMAAAAMAPVRAPTSIERDATIDDNDEVGLLHNVALNDVNPLLRKRSSNIDR